jgi:4-hydroxy-4-methyl-2-oxoglutarate aldolase
MTRAARADGDDGVRSWSANIPAECAGVFVRSGDIVFGDADGMAVIPREHEAAMLTKAREKAQGEGRTRVELRQGRLLGKVYSNYGVL